MLGFELTGKWNDCVHCSKAKVKKKTINKITEKKEENKGDRIAIDTTSCSSTSI